MGSGLGQYVQENPGQKYYAGVQPDPQLSMAASFSGLVSSAARCFPLRPAVLWALKPLSFWGELR